MVVCVWTAGIEIVRGCSPTGMTDIMIVCFHSGHCRQLAPKWMKLAKALKGIVKIGAVNCEADPGLCQDYGVQGYPTIVSLRFVSCSHCSSESLSMLLLTIIHIQ